MGLEFCGDYNFLEAVRIIKYVIYVFKIIIPIILISLGVFDFYKVVTSGDRAILLNQVKLFSLRVVSAMIIFLLPSIISICFNTFANYSNQLLLLDDCLKNANSEYITQLKGIAKELREANKKEPENYTVNFDKDKLYADSPKDDSSSTNQDSSTNQSGSGSASENGSGNNTSESSETKHDNSSESGSSNNQNDAGDFLKLAADLWGVIVNGSYTYGGSSVPVSGSTVDCSSFVSWVLYEYGYNDFKGYQHITQQFVNTDWSSEYGWEEVTFNEYEDVTSMLKPGDILVRDPGNNNGHMNIIAEVTEDGTVLAYDCGATKNWKNSDGGPIDKSWFAKKDSRKGKIIRVTKPS